MTAPDGPSAELDAAAPALTTEETERKYLGVPTTAEVEALVADNLARMEAAAAQYKIALNRVHVLEVRLMLLVEHLLGDMTAGSRRVFEHKVHTAYAAEVTKMVDTWLADQSAAAAERKAADARQTLLRGVPGVRIPPDVGRVPH